MAKMTVKNFGPIRLADVSFGGLTVFVGPQAAGKSIFLQLLKLLVDVGPVMHEFRRAGIDWEDSFRTFLDVYFGEGMRSLWESNATKIMFDGVEVNLRKLVYCHSSNLG
jgi:AAA15 family ATPase/GTPase